MCAGPAFRTRVVRLALRFTLGVVLASAGWIALTVAASGLAGRLAGLGGHPPAPALSESWYLGYFILSPLLALVSGWLGASAILRRAHGSGAEPAPGPGDHKRVR